MSQSDHFMRFQKLLFLYPQYPGSHYSHGRTAFPPIGLGIIGEMLTRINIAYEIVDMGLGYNRRDVFERITAYQPDALVFSMMTFRYRHSYALLEDIKQVFPGIPIIVGGPHVTAWKTNVLEQCPAIDFGVSREGEYTICELCDGRELAEIKGLIYREDGRIVFTGERELIPDLDAIPFPRYEKFELTRYQPRMQILSSRGCPYQCIFCQSCSTLGKKWRSRSAGNMTEEMQFWYEKGYRDFVIVDDNFTLNKPRIYDLCDEIDHHFQADLRLSAPGIRVDLVDRALLIRMKEVGFYYVAFGIEAGNNHILKSLKKGFRIEQADQSVKDATELGFEVKLYFLVGSPYETLQDVQDSIDFALKYPLCDVNFGSLMPIPETELMDWVIREGRLLAPPEVYLNEFAEFERIPHFVAPGMTLKERRYALRLTENVGKMVRKKHRQKKFERQFAYLGIAGKFMAAAASSNVINAVLNHDVFIPVKNILKKVFLKS